jgi:hypothetical protein
MLFKIYFVMAQKFNVTGEQRDDIDGQMIEIKRQLRLKSGSPIDPELVKLALQDIVEGIFNDKKVVKNEVIEKPSILRLISGGHVLTLKALDGKRLIYKAKKTFPSYLDSDFVNWGINKPGLATAETPVQVREIVQDGTFMDIFSALPGNWNQKWVSQNQVIEFCETLSEWLRQEGNATLFLVKKDENKPIDENNPKDNLVVVLVFVPSDGLIVYVYRLGRGGVWDGKCLSRVVSPQLLEA